MRIELITTGSELTLGFTLNTHLSYLGRQLAGLGLRLQRQTTVADDRAEMRTALTEALARADVVLVTGGLGPTSDDVTRDVVAELLGRPLAPDAGVTAAIADRYRKRGLVMPATINVQAMVPAGAQVLSNRHGTAPGLALVEEGRLIVLLPGPPRELNPMFVECVVPLLQERAGPHPAFGCRVYKVVGLPESVVEAKVAPVLAGLRDLELGYCARPGEVEVRTIAPEPAVLDEADARIRGALGDHLYGMGDDRLEAVVVRMLTAAGRTLAVAESCTGGLIAHRLTNVSGASVVFRSGWVTYADETKQRELGVSEQLLARHGAVSEEVARAMAEGARRRADADFGVSCTGIAGPTGGSVEKPVGLVFVGLAAAEKTSVQRHVLAFDRETFKFFASQIALDLVRRAVMGIGP